MGRPMAARIAAAGWPLRVLDADAVRTKAGAAEIGVASAASARDLAAACDVIVLVLPNSAVVAAVLEGEAGLLAGLRPGALVLDMTSGEPARTHEFAARVAASGGALVDAPVSGGVPRARTGELAIMLGGGDEAVSLAEPLLRCMGNTVTRTGAVGSAHAMKALNNLVSAGGFLIGIEALLIGSRFGLDPALMVDVLNASTGMNNSTQRKFKQFVLSREFNAGFGLDLMVKDLGIALAVARDTDTPAPFAALCRELWAAAAALLGPGRDHTELARLSERLVGSELG